MPTEVRVATNKHQNTQRLLLKPFFADTLNKLEVPWILGFFTQSSALTNQTHNKG